ncbi:hypothetical protein MKW92_014542 [Papaver armeniacum]|nr:hypothetical protein MKW92_014542 [Papaver armeniacum]
MAKTHLIFSPFLLVILIVLSFGYVNGIGPGGDYDVQCIAVAKIPEVRSCDECHFACYVYVQHKIIPEYSGTSCEDDSVNAGAYICTCCA